MEKESISSRTSESHTLLLSERNTAKAQALDLEQLLTAAHANLELANTDCNRALMAKKNLQRALADVWGKRDAEIALLIDQRLTNEEAIAGRTRRCWRSRGR